MSERRIHLIRHGEVNNPDGILYGRLPGFHLTDRGQLMARTAAQSLFGQGRDVSAVFSSPLLRAQESAAPFVDIYRLPVLPDERLIEAGNVFEGGTKQFGPRLALRPATWRYLWNPWRPSWGEPYRAIAARMLDAMRDAWRQGGDRDVVLVSHQSPVWIAHLAIAGERLAHDPRSRRAALSSITSFTYDPSSDTFREVDYQDPAAGLPAVDEGAV